MCSLGVYKEHKSNFISLTNLCQIKDLLRNFKLSAEVEKNSETLLTPSMPLLFFCAPWKHQKVWGFLMFSEYRKTPVTWNGLTNNKTFIGRNRRSQMIFKVGVLKNFSNFTGKHLCWSLFLHAWRFLHWVFYKKTHFHEAKHKEAINCEEIMKRHSYLSPREKQSFVSIQLFNTKGKPIILLSFSR